jgi:hypothetical protein
MRMISRMSRSLSWIPVAASIPTQECKYSTFCETVYQRHVTPQRRLGRVDAWFQKPFREFWNPIWRAELQFRPQPLSLPRAASDRRPVPRALPSAQPRRLNPGTKRRLLRSVRSLRRRERTYSLWHRHIERRVGSGLLLRPAGSVATAVPHPRDTDGQRDMPQHNVQLRCRLLVGKSDYFSRGRIRSY